ncbi:MAG TPA: hypothetical protein VFH01_06800 [Pyrinomonadaceae bacterium]|nr:hypothetical protein [Pyrinomonadaceae bacterium]
MSAEDAEDGSQGQALSATPQIDLSVNHQSPPIYLSPFQGSKLFRYDPGVTHSASLRAPPLATFCRAFSAS